LNGSSIETEFAERRFKGCLAVTLYPETLNFSSVTPIPRPSPVNTGLPFTWMNMVAENTLIRLEDRLVLISDATWINIADIDGHITRDNFRVLLVVFAAIIVVSIASLEVEV
jgi:hypothetical protein